MLDWRLVLGRLRPTSSYHWLGDGVNDTYESIGEWRDSLTTKPTEQECLDEWDVYVVEKTAEEELVIANVQLDDTADTQIDLLVQEYKDLGLFSKTVTEIYVAMRNNIDAWNVPQAVKDDLRVWLPLMGASIVWITRRLLRRA